MIKYFLLMCLSIKIEAIKRWCLDEKNLLQILPKTIKFFESYTFQSKDGYFTKVFRIRNSKESLPVVVLNHSLNLSSDQFINNPKGNLAEVLVAQGYDVWMIN